MSVYSWTETVWDCIRSRKTSIMARTADITKIHGRSPSQPEDVNMSQHCFTLAFSASRGEQDMLKTNYWHHQCVKSLYVGSQSPLYWNMVCFWLDESFFHLFKPNMGVLLQYRVRLICINERQLSATRWSAILHPTGWCACTLCDNSHSGVRCTLVLFVLSSSSLPPLHPFIFLSLLNNRNAKWWELKHQKAHFPAWQSNLPFPIFTRT